MKSSILCIVLFAVVALSDPQGLPEPDMIVELFRHGARGPLSIYDSSWPLYQFGMLTPVGLRQQYILGKVLSEKYPDLIGSAYNYSEIYTLTDTTPRCIQSAGAHLYGMYLGKGPALPDTYPPELAIPPYKDPRVDAIADSLPDSEAMPNNFVPGIIDIVDVNNAMIFQGDQGLYCPNSVNWEIQNGNDTLAQQAFEIFGETIANVNKLLNSSMQLTTANDITAFGDTMLVDLYDNRTLPAGLNDPALITNMTWAFSWFTYHVWEGQATQRQVAAFNLIDAILQQLESFRKGTNTNKVALYSGHDDNVWAVLAAFGFVTEQCILDNFYSVVENGTLVHPTCYYPYFASDLIVEFFNQTETPYVKFYYNNVILPICNGQYNCSYDEFVTYAKSAVGNLTLESYFSACGANATYLQSIGLANLTTVTTSLEEALFVTKTNSVKTEMLAVVALAIICFMLVVKMVFDKKKYSEEIKAARSHNVLYDKLTGIEA